MIAVKAGRMDLPEGTPSGADNEELLRSIEAVARSRVLRGRRALRRSKRSSAR